MKHYTTVRQSRKLVRLGLDPNTADMAYLKFASSDNLTPRFEGAAPMVLMDLPISEIDCQTLPCWSLGALLNLMPDILFTKEKNIYYFSHPDSNHIEQNMSLITAGYSMICWLLENNYIVK